MKISCIVASCALFLASPALGQKAYVDYDQATAFSQYQTFKLEGTHKDLSRSWPKVHQMIIEQLTAYILAGGMKQDLQNPDVHIAYYAADRGDLRLVLSDLQYTYGPGFSPGGYWEGGVGTRTPDSYTFKEGTLIIDAWDAKDKRLVWRGMATAALSKNPDKNTKKVEKGLENIMKEWDKMYGGYVRKLRAHQQQSADP